MFMYCAMITEERKIINFTLEILLKVKTARLAAYCGLKTERLDQ